MPSPAPHPDRERERITCAKCLALDGMRRGDHVDRFHRWAWNESGDGSRWRWIRCEQCKYRWRDIEVPSCA